MSSILEREKQKRGGEKEEENQRIEKEEEKEKGEREREGGERRGREIGERGKKRKMKQRRADKGERREREGRNRRERKKGREKEDRKVRFIIMIYKRKQRVVVFKDYFITELRDIRKYCFQEIFKMCGEFLVEYLVFNKGYVFNIVIVVKD